MKIEVSQQTDSLSVWTDSKVEIICQKIWAKVK